MVPFLPHHPMWDRLKQTEVLPLLSLGPGFHLDKNPCYKIVNQLHIKDGVVVTITATLNKTLTFNMA